MQLVFGAGLRRRSLTFHPPKGTEATEPLPLVEIAALGGLSPAETCHVVLHVLAPRAWPDAGVLADWYEISPGIRATLQAIPEPSEDPAFYYPDPQRKLCTRGEGTRGGINRGPGSGSRYLRDVCQQPGCGYQVRVTRRWLRLGIPRCPVDGHGTMELMEQPP